VAPALPWCMPARRAPCQEPTLGHAGPPLHGEGSLGTLRACCAHIWPDRPSATKQQAGRPLGSLHLRHRQPARLRRTWVSRATGRRSFASPCTRAARSARRERPAAGAARRNVTTALLSGVIDVAVNQGEDVTITSISVRAPPAPHDYRFRLGLGYVIGRSGTSNMNEPSFLPSLHACLHRR